MPQSFQSFNIICIETILSSGDEQHEVLWLNCSYRRSWDPAMCCVSAKTAKNVGCIGDATIFSIFQYYMYRDNSILRRRAARSAVARQQLPWVMGPGLLCERKACKKCRMYTVMPQSFQSFNIICIETILSSGDEQHEVLWLDSSYRGSWDPAAV